MTIIVFGRNGQLASDLKNAGAGHHMLFLGRHDIDITNRIAVADVIARHQPSAIINAAAYTDVDKAGSEMEAAFALNADAPRIIAEAMGERAIPLLHVSTDQVFDGTKSGPYVETDAPNPINTYGRSKHAGEEALLSLRPDALILRVSWLWGPSGDNFVKKLLNWARQKPNLYIVADQIGKPTYSPALARHLLALATMTEDKRPQGLLHLAGADALRRADQARIVMRHSALASGPNATISDVTTAAFPTPAARPLNAILDTSLAIAHGLQMKTFEEDLSHCLGTLIEETGR